MASNGLAKQIFATISASLSIFIAGCWLGWPAATTDKFLNHQTGIEVTYPQLSWIVSCMDIGNVLSPIPAGFLMDRFGRKKTVIFLGPVFIVSWALPVFLNHIWALYLARFLGGVGKGVSYTVVPIFLGEIAGVKIRGALSSVFTIQLAAGMLFELVVGPIVTYKTLNAISAVVPVLFFILFIWIAESPYYLLKNGRRDQAAKCLGWYRAGDDSELQLMEATVQEEMMNKGTYSELFTNKKNLKVLFIVVSACFSQRAGGVSSLIAFGSLSLPDPSPLVSKSNYIVLFGILHVALSFVGMSLVDVVGRKPLLILSEASLGVITFVYGLYFYVGMYTDVSQYNWVPYACYEMFSVMYALGVGFIPVVFLGEMLPVNVRAHGSAVMSIALAFSSLVSNKMYLFVSTTYGFHVILWVYTVVNLVCAFLAYKMALETKGKTFLEIQNMLENSGKNGSEGKINAKT
ncbi:facilitated trehalose transporter Tret1-like [Adelges cooleyi]|uniref:facilitated trehalose transporter Tret1-like n=1 Tax=Adelges cooleyi TaxID=133065 RepID=UPI00218073A8|nr:facilitated trehalose transporter Tret1-like [Adelges cooleyi]